MMGNCQKNEEKIDNIEKSLNYAWTDIRKNRQEIQALKENDKERKVEFGYIKKSLEGIEKRLDNSLGKKLVEKVIGYLIIFVLAALLAGGLRAETTKINARTERSNK
jgi:predicted DNA binding CopG/RHH family protein